MLLVSRDMPFVSQETNAWRTRREESPVGLSRLTSRKEFTSSDAVLPEFCLPGSGGRTVAQVWLSKEELQVAKKAKKKPAKKAAKKKAKK